MTKYKSHTDALSAYINLLEKSGSKRVDVSLKDHMARQLISNLHQESVDPTSYRLAVDSLLASLPADYKADATLVAREFFPLLVSDVKTVVAMLKVGGYRGFSANEKVVKDESFANINELITASERQKYPAQQITLYDQYLASLGLLGAEKKEIAMRGKISRTLLFVIREVDVNPVQYRTVIDRILPILPSEETRLYFVMVAREFYQFLTKNPDAATMINVANVCPANLAQ